MAISYDSTITDKKSFSCNVVDKKKYETLSQLEKEIFESLRNSMLEIYPTETGNTYNDETIRYAENFAFIALKGVLNVIDKRFDELKDALITEIMTQVKLLLPTSTAAGTTNVI